MSLLTSWAPSCGIAVGGVGAVMSEMGVVVVGNRAACDMADVGYVGMG